MSEKKIVIQGMNNRRQINNLIKPKSVQQKKNIIPIEDIYYEAGEQLNIIKNIYSSLSIHIESEIKSKISSYKQQDKHKNVYDENKFIPYEKIISLLEENNCKCFYCGIQLLIFYKHKNDKNQWTLDRIDNNIGHNSDNVVCSCLKCNIQKRDRSHEKFMFTKNLKIQKI